jgi:glycosyltransferase involved in cell wall biosynthesis
MNKVSVVIPFRCDLESLAACLECLSRQTWPPFEILAVNNGPEDSDAPLRKLYPGVRWLFEAKPGSYNARNCALSHASGDIVAFTDSDCQPAPDWLAKGVDALRTSKATIAGGNIRLIEPANRPLNVYEIFESQRFAMANSQRMVETRGFVATANAFTYRDVFQRTGVFDGALRSSGDREWSERAVAGGETIRYVPSAIVFHPRRSTFAAISKKTRRIVGGRVTLAKMKKNRLRRLVRIVRDIQAQSFLSLKVHKYALFAPEVTGLVPRLQFFCLVETMSLVSTCEQLRVAFGGEPCRE